MAVPGRKHRLSPCLIDSHFLVAVKFRAIARPGDSKLLPVGQIQAWAFVHCCL